MTPVNLKLRAYRLFVDLCRKEHQKMFPEIKVTSLDFSKFCGLRWRQLTPQQKSKFEQLWLKSNGQLEDEEDKSMSIETCDGDGDDDVQASEEKKANKEAEVENVEKTPSDDVKGVELGDEPGPAPKKKRSYVRKNPPANAGRVTTISKGQASRKKLKKSGVKGVRPSYALFLSEVCEKARANGTGKGLGIQYFMKEAAKLWSEMTEEEKKKYRDKCEEDKIRYRREKEEHEKSLLEESSLAIGDDDESDVEEDVEDEEEG